MIEQEVKSVELTELEYIIVGALSNGDDFDGMPSECIHNLKNNTGISIKVLRGVLSSLLQKDIIMIGEYPNGMTAFHLIVK